MEWGPAQGCPQLKMLLRGIKIDNFLNLKMESRDAHGFFCAVSIPPKSTMNLVGGFSEWILDTQQSLGSFCDSTTQADLPTSLHSILGRKCKQARSVMSLNPKPKSNRPKWITDWGLLEKGPTALKQKLDVKAAPCSLDHHHPPSLL